MSKKYFIKIWKNLTKTPSKFGLAETEAPKITNANKKKISD